MSGGGGEKKGLELGDGLEKETVVLSRKEAKIRNSNIPDNFTSSIDNSKTRLVVDDHVVKSFKSGNVSLDGEHRAAEDLELFNGLVLDQFELLRIRSDEADNIALADNIGGAKARSIRLLTTGLNVDNNSLALDGGGMGLSRVNDENTMVALGVQDTETLANDSQNGGLLVTLKPKVALMANGSNLLGAKGLADGLKVILGDGANLLEPLVAKDALKSLSEALEDVAGRNATKVLTILVQNRSGKNLAIRKDLKSGVNISSLGQGVHVTMVAFRKVAKRFLSKERAHRLEKGSSRDSHFS
mmetsp:Transcript_11200/g.20276  ORF Transcript_11200/g.20276 Transcript_11200/m.20276 type:complete len:300 (+) Transcript_11200:2225-3124(+)